MNRERREFLKNAFKLAFAVGGITAGITALITLGLSVKEANAISLIGSGVASGGPSQPEISDDFSGDLSAWTNPLGTGAAFIHDTDNDNLDSPSSTGVILHNTETSTINQYVAAKIVSAPASYNGFILRNDGGTSNTSYTVRNAVGSNFDFRYCDGTEQTNCITVDTVALQTPAINDFWGVKISGTGSGSGTTVKVYFWVAGSYGSVPDIANWDSDNTDTATFDTSTIADLADTGKQLGFYQGSTGSQTWDDFIAGSF